MCSTTLFNIHTICIGHYTNLLPSSYLILSKLYEPNPGVKSRLLFFRHFFLPNTLMARETPPHYGILNFHFFNLFLSDSTRILDSTMQLHRSILASVLTALLVSRLTLTTEIHPVVTSWWCFFTKFLQVARIWVGGEVIRAMPERKHFFREVVPKMNNKR